MDGKTDLELYQERIVEAETQAVARMGPPHPSITESWTTIKLADGWEARTKVIEPVDRSEPRPLVVLLYGGGFALGTPEQMTEPGRSIAEKLGAVVVCPDYKRVRAHQFPAGPRSVWDVLVHQSRHAAADFGATLGGPGGGFVVAGVSAGGSLAVVAACMSLFGAEDAGLEPLAAPLTGVFTAVPLILTEDIVPDEYKSLWTSRDDNRHVEKFDTATVLTALDWYLPDVKSPWFSPFNLFAKHEAAAELPSPKPRFYVQVMQYDPLRDDGVLLEKELAKRGFETRIDLFPDDGHNAWTAIAAPCKSKDPTFNEATITGMRWLLQRD